MAQNNFILNLIAGLNKTRSKQQIKADAKSLGDIYVKLIGNLNMTKTRQYIKNQLKGLKNMTFNITPKVNTNGVQNTMKQSINAAQKVANSNKIRYSFDMDKKKLQNQLKNFASENSKLFSSKEMTSKYNQLLNLTHVAKSKSELNALRKQLSAFRTELIATGKSGMVWTDKFKASISHFAQYFSGASFIYAMTNQLRNAWTEAKTLDDSLVDLQKVTSEIADRDALYKYFDKAMSKAQELNVKVGDLIDAITEFKKLGWSLSDAELGAEWATKLANVGDVDIETAIGSIKTSIASFDEIGGYGDDQLDKKLEAYVDLINNMSNKYSIDAEGLAESIRLSAGTLTEAHTSIEQAATMFATANKYYNDPSYLGNTAKIGSLRMRASTGDTSAIEELQEMGEEVDDLAEATSKLREKLLALTGVDIMVDDHTFKSYYQQLFEISQVIDQLDDTSRANVLETMFGKARAAGGAAILSGMKESATAYQDAINSAGSSTQEYETWMRSAEAATQRFSNNLIQTYQQIINGNTVRDLANLGSAVLEFANKFGIIEGTLKGFLALKTGTFLTNATMAFLSATKQVEQYGKALQMVNNIPNGNLSQRFTTLKSIAQATESLSTTQLKQVLSNQALTQSDRIRILMMQGMTKEMALQKLAEMNLTQATNAQTAANAAQTASTFSLKSAMIGLGNTIRSIFLSNPVGIALMAISIGVTAVTSAVSKHNQKMEEMRDKAKQAADEANTLGDEISELTNKYIQLSEAVKTDSSAKEDLMSTQTELLKKLGRESEGIDTLIEKYGSLSAAIKQASIDSLQNARIDLLAGVNTAKEELLDIGSDGFWGGNNIINAIGDDAVKAFKELEKAGVVSSGSYSTDGGSLVLTGDDKTTEGILENYNRLKKGLAALRDSNAFTSEELSDNSLYQAMYARYTEMTEAVNNYKGAIGDFNENVAQETMFTALQGKEIPKTEEEFETYRQELIDTAVASKQFIGNEKEITDAINNYLSTVPQFEGFYSVPLENELDKVDTLLDQDRFSKTFISTISKVQSLSKGLDQLGKIYNDVKDGGTFDWSSILNNDDFKTTFGNMTNATSEYKTVYDDFIKTIANNPNDIEACQEAFNNLANAYIDNSGALSTLTEETADSAIVLLREMGIANASSIVHNRLAINKFYAGDAAKNHGEALYEEINALISEDNQIDASEKALIAYALEKEIANGTVLDTSGDVENLIILVGALGGATTALEEYQRLKSAFDNTKDRQAKSLLGRELAGFKEAAIAEIQAAINEAKTVVDYNGQGSSSGSSSYYDTYQEMLDDKQAAIDKYLENDEKLNTRYEEAVRVNNQELARSLKDQIVANKDDLQKAYADSASYIRNVLNGEVLPAIFTIAPQLEGIDVSEWSDVIIKDIAESLSDSQQTIFNSLISAAQAMYEKVGSANGEGEWAEKYFAIPSEVDKAITDYYNNVIEWDNEVIEAQEKITEAISDRISALDDELDILEAEKEAYEDIAYASGDIDFISTTAQREYDIYINKLAQLREEETSLSKELEINESLLKKYKQELAEKSAANKLGAESQEVLTKAIEDTTNKINENKSALRKNKQTTLEYYNDILSQIEDNLKEIYSQKREREQEALTKRQEEASKVLENQIELLDKKKQTLDDINSLMEIELELQKVLRDRNSNTIIDENGREVFTYDIEREKELRAQLLEEQANQAYEAQKEALEKQQEALTEQHEKEQEEFDNYYDKLESDYAVHLEALRLAQEYGYEKALLGTNDYLNRLEQSLYEENSGMYNAGLNLSQSLADGMFENLDSFLGKYAATISDTIVEIADEISETVSGTFSDRLSTIQQMKANSMAWATASASERQRLAEENQALGAGIGAYYDKYSGTWYTDNTKSQLLYNELNSNNNALGVNSSLLKANNDTVNENITSLGSNTIRVGKNTVSLDKNTVTVTNSTESLTYSVDELMANNDLLMDALDGSADDMADVMSWLVDSLADLDFTNGNNNKQTPIFGYGDANGDGVRDTALVEKLGSDPFRDTSEFKYDPNKNAFVSGNGMVISGVGSSVEAEKAREQLQKGTTKATEENTKQTIISKNATNKNTNALTESTTGINDSATSIIGSNQELIKSNNDAAKAIEEALADIEVKVNVSGVGTTSSSGKSYSSSSSGGSSSSGSSQKITYYTWSDGSVTSSTSDNYLTARKEAGKDESVGLKRAITTTIKKHDGMKSGFVGSNTSLTEKEKLFQKLALNEIELKSFEVPAILKEGEGVVTSEQITSIVDSFTELLRNNYIPPSVAKAYKPLNISQFRNNTPQNVDNSRSINLYNTVVKANNPEEFIREMQIMSNRLQ